MQSPSAPQRRSKRPDYNLIHARPLPLTITPYPPLIPHNPLSILHILYTFFFARPSCLPDPIYVATFHPETRCVHVTDTQSILALWNDGFFGKGSLSRSEPTWLSRKKRALGILGKDEDLTAEEWTERRRQQRKEFKLERARAEKERIQKQLEHEGKIQNATSNPDSPVPNEVKHDIASESDPLSQLVAETVVEEEKGHKDVMPEIVSVENLEHLQLTPEEAFFLVYGLGSLEITDSVSNKTYKATELFDLFRRYSYFPPLENPSSELQPDDPFLVNYVVYHHFRSLGWVVRPGVKFGVDYLLYNRGPVFTHAEFGILILPSYSDPYWSRAGNRKKKERKPWHWLHSVNRVSSQVKKTVIIVYVDIPPPPLAPQDDLSISDTLKRYKVREFSLRRWIVSRNRD